MIKSITVSEISFDPCDPSLGSLEDISPAQIYHADLTSVIFFLLYFVAIYSLNVGNIHFFILVFSDPTLFSLSFPVSYFLCLLLSTFLLCLSLHMLYLLSLCLSCLPFTFFFATLYLSPLTFFLCLPPNFSFCFYLSLSSTFFLCFILLPFFACLLFHSLTLLFILLHTCVCVLLLLLLSFLSSCSYFLYFLPIF